MIYQHESLGYGSVCCLSGFSSVNLLFVPFDSLCFGHKSLSPAPTLAEETIYTYHLEFFCKGKLSFIQSFVYINMHSQILILFFGL